MNISLKKRTFLILLAGLTATFASAQEQPLPEWQSQYAVGLNKLAPHTYVWPYANASDIEKPGGYEQSPFYMTLNGKWKFHWVKNPDNRPKDFSRKQGSCRPSSASFLCQFCAGLFQYPRR